MEIKKANIKDVAKRANVSTATVSNVMNSSRFVKEETRMKVLKAMEELKYTPSTVAKSLKGIETRVIGLIIPILQNDTSAEFFLSLSNGIESVLNNEGYRLVISNSHENTNKELDQINMYKTQFVDYIDGLIIAPTSDMGYESDYSLNLDTPVVYVDRKPKSLNKVDTVYTDNYFVTYEAIEMMLNKNRKRIAFISGPNDVSSVMERFEAYQDVLGKFQFELNEELIFEGESSFESGYKIASKLFSNQEVDGIVVVNNTMSMGVYKFLNENNIVIPEEVSFLSYDDFLWMELTNPSITTIKQPAFEMGEAAAKLLLEKLEDNTKEPKEICVKSSIIIRNSL